MAELRWVDTSSGVRRLAAELADARWLAVDTEFANEKTYYPRLCLIQVGWTSGVACVDPLARGIDLEPLLDLLRAGGIRKILHAAVNDLAVLHPLVGGVCAPVFDTQLAAAFVGHGPSVGYGPLLEHVTGIQLDKGWARTDWSARPLPQAALRYAADDVRHLAGLVEHLESELSKSGRTPWFEEDSAALVATASEPDQDPSHAWRRVRGWQRIDPSALPLLRELAAWRERAARAANRPRRRVLDDELLLQIARFRPGSLPELERLHGFRADWHGAEVGPLLAIASAGPYPELSTFDLPPDRDERAVLDGMRTAVSKIAASEGLPDALLATSEELLRVRRGATDERPLRGWREALLGPALRAFRP
ncbi:MAG: ribonuclease [Planctomycetota bacterium]